MLINQFYNAINVPGQYFIMSKLGRILVLSKYFVIIVSRFTPYRLYYGAVVLDGAEGEFGCEP